MKVSQKNITLAVDQTKKVSDIIVSITIAFKGIADCCFKKLKNNCFDSQGLMKGSEQAATAFALYESIRDKLSGSGLELFKTKASNVNCNIINGHIVITWHTQGTGTALRKSAGLALTCMNPIKLFSKYSENIKFLSGKGGNREEFNYVAKQLAESIKKSIQITCIGKINTDTNKLKDIIEVLANKLPDIEMPGAKEITAPKTAMGMDMNEQYPIVKCSGLSAAITADYIRNSSNGMAVGIDELGVIIYNKSWESKHRQLQDKKRIEDYIDKKYAKIEDKDELSPIFAYFALSEGFCDGNVAASLISTTLKTDKMIEILKKTL